MNINNSHLGQKSAYIDQYDASLLFPIPRATKRNEIGISEHKLPFSGVDTWNHYEVSWLNPKGKPQVATCKITYPCQSPNIIESKSMKLYFNSFNNFKFESLRQVEDIITTDLSNGVGAKVIVTLSLLKTNKLDQISCHFNGICLDDLDIECNVYQPTPEYLTTTDEMVKEILYSDLLKSNCLVTFQPDWGSVQISYSGKKINHDGLLRYIISLRCHNEFHEQCVERIYNDIWTRCTPNELTVYARYTRRGGLDINPFRSSTSDLPVDMRLIRQ